MADYVEGAALVAQIVAERNRLRTTLTQARELAIDYRNAQRSPFAPAGATGIILTKLLALLTEPPDG